jgi:hypothetical protein
MLGFKTKIIEIIKILEFVRNKIVNRKETSNKMSSKQLFITTNIK